VSVEALRNSKSSVKKLMPAVGNFFDFIPFVMIAYCFRIIANVHLIFIDKEVLHWLIFWNMWPEVISVFHGLWFNVNSELTVSSCMKLII